MSCFLPESLDGGEVDLVHFILNHHGQHVRTAAPRALHALTVLNDPVLLMLMTGWRRLQQFHHLTGQPPQPGLPFDPVAGEEAGHEVATKVGDPGAGGGPMLLGYGLRLGQGDVLWAPALLDHVQRVTGPEDVTSSGWVWKNCIILNQKNKK